MKTTSIGLLTVCVALGGCTILYEAQLGDIDPVRQDAHRINVVSHTQAPIYSFNTIELADVLRKACPEGHVANLISIHELPGYFTRTLVRVDGVCSQ